jgi:hypothetical protein
LVRLTFVAALAGLGLLAWLGGDPTVSEGAKAAKEWSIVPPEPL